MEQQFIEEHDIKIENIKIEQEYTFYEWVNPLELQQFQPIMIEARVNLTPVEKVCKCKKDVPVTRGMASKHKKYCYLLYN